MQNQSSWSNHIFQCKGFADAKLPTLLPSLHVSLAKDLHCCRWRSTAMWRGLLAWAQRLCLLCCCTPLTLHLGGLRCWHIQVFKAYKYKWTNSWVLWEMCQHMICVVLLESLPCRSERRQPHIYDLTNWSTPYYPGRCSQADSEIPEWAVLHTSGIASAPALLVAQGGKWPLEASALGIRDFEIILEKGGRFFTSFYWLYAREIVEA